MWTNLLQSIFSKERKEGTFHVTAAELHTWICLWLYILHVLNTTVDFSLFNLKLNIFYCLLCFEILQLSIDFFLSFREILWVFFFFKYLNEQTRNVGQATVLNALWFTSLFNISRTPLESVKILKLQNLFFFSSDLIKTWYSIYKKVVFLTFRSAYIFHRSHTENNHEESQDSNRCLFSLFSL